MVALDHGFVAKHGVEHLRTQADVTDRADAALRFRHGHAVAPPRHHLEDRQGLTGELRHECRAFGLERADLLLELLVFARDGSLLGVRRFLEAPQFHVRRLGRAGQIVGFHHPFEHPIFVTLDLVLSKRHLVLNGVVLLIGLHGRCLIAKFRQPALMDGEFLLDLASRELILRHALLGRRRDLPGLFHPGLEFEQPCRLIAKRSLGLVNRRVESLERDQPFEICMHVSGPLVRRRAGHVRRDIKKAPTLAHRGLVCDSALDTLSRVEGMAGDGLVTGPERMDLPRTCSLRGIHRERSQRALSIADGRRTRERRLPCQPELVSGVAPAGTWADWRPRWTPPRDHVTWRVVGPPGFEPGTGRL